MGVLIINSDSTPSCTIEGIGVIRKRKEVDLGENIEKIRRHLRNFFEKVDNMNDPVIKDFSQATTFPVKDIQKLLVDNPDCEFIRVYNGIEAGGKYITYLSGITSELESIFNRPKGVITAVCCHCKPCFADGLLNGGTSSYEGA